MQVELFYRLLYFKALFINFAFTPCDLWCHAVGMFLQCFGFVMYV